MKMRKSLGLVAVIAAIVLSTGMLALADPPSRVARLQYISGQISVQPGGVDDWVEAGANRPLTTADRVWADKESRGELQLGGALMRINAETSMTLTNVNDQTVQVELDQGTLNVWVRHLYDGEIYEIDTPNVAFTVTKAGEYRFDVDPDNDTTFVTVWKGKGEATGDDRAVTIRRGEQAKFMNGNSLEHEMLDQPERDGFDDWCRVRDDRFENSQSARYVSPDVIGAQDLDNYGAWRAVPSYGAVWYPTVAPGWAPYHDGHWVWVEPWGWTWVDDAPWGFAPAHYGRWVYYGGAWGWVPGPVAVRPVYAPALVAWVGGPNFGVAITSGEPVGWFPLGYGEPYIPPYAVSRGYFQQVNTSNTRITNITTVTNNYYTTNVTNVNVTKITYVNQRVPGAVTAVPRDAMVSSQSVARHSIQIPPGQLRHASVAVAPRVAPERESVLGERMDRDRPRNVPVPRAQPRPVVSHVAPPPRPVSFEDKREALAKNPGRPLDRKDEDEIRARVGRQQPNPPGRGPAQAVGPQHENEGLHRGQMGTQPGQENRNARGPVQPAGPQHENEGLHRGQMGTQPGQENRNPRATQPGSDMRVTGRVPVSSPGAAADNGQGRDNNRGQANGHYVPRPPQPGQQAEQQGQRGNGNPREMETRGGQNQPNRQVEPAVGRPAQGRMVQEPQNENRSVPQLQQDRGNGFGREKNSTPAAQPAQSAPAQQPQEQNVPRPPQQDRGNGFGRERNSTPAAQPSQSAPAQQPQEQNVPRPPQRNMNESSAPAQAAPQQHGNSGNNSRGNSGNDQQRGNGNNAAPQRSNGQGQGARNSAPAAPSVQQTSYENRPAASQPEARQAPQEQPQGRGNSGNGNGGGSHEKPSHPDKDKH